MFRTFRRTSRPTNHRRLNSGLWLQPLEDRAVPANLSVTSALDDLSAGTFRSILAIANSNADADVITFDTGAMGTTSITLSTTGQWPISEASQNITIDGGGAVTLVGNATASATNRLFSVTATGKPSISFKNITMTAGQLTGTTNHGAAVLITDQSVSFTNVAFTGNKTGGSGGAVASGSASASLAFDSCTFTNNSATSSGGALHIGASATTVTITNSTFTTNTAAAAGAINAAGVTVPLTISGSTFTGNTSTGGSNGAGAINFGIGASSITTSSFTNNKAANVGGALSVPTTSANANITIGNSTFTQNSAGASGGAFSNTGVATLVINGGSTFSGNSAGTSGGAMVFGAANTNVTINGASFTGNSSNTTGGSINTASSTVTLNFSSVTFSNNKAGSSGGAVNFGLATVATMSQVTFANNTATTTGGAINGASSVNMGTLVDSCTFTGNVATSGGAMRFALGNTSVTLTNCVVSSNTATTGNGGAFEYNSNGRLYIFNSTVATNVAGGNGGAGALGPVSLTVSNATISGNTAKGATGGGAFFTSGSGANPITIRNSTIAANTAAAGKGGAFAIAGAAAPGVATIFESNIIAGNNAAVSDRDFYSTTSWTINGLKNLFGSLDTAITPLFDGANNQFGSDTSPINPGVFPLSSYKAGPNGMMTHGLHYTSPALGAGYYPATPTPTFTNDQRNLSAWPAAGPLPGSATDVGAVIGADSIPFVASIQTLTDVTTGGGTLYTVVITYDDENAIDVASLGNDDLVISGPTAVGALQYKGHTKLGNQVTATYEFAPPGGSWDILDGGVYTVSVAAGKVLDTDGTPHGVYGETLGSFKVGIVGAITVDSTADGIDGDYSTGQLTLREAVALANTATTGTSTIQFALGINNQTITLTGNEMAVTNPVVINGPGVTLLTVSGATAAGSTNRLFNINIPVSATSQAISISSITLSGGNLSSGNGGAILAADESVSFTGVNLSGNKTAGAGGAVAASGAATLNFTNSTISTNTATSTGGAINAAAVATVSISNSTVSSNSAGGNGGVLSVPGVNGNVVSFTNSAFSSNVSNSSGGVLIGNSTINLSITGSTFTSNKAVSQGGVMFMGAGAVTITTSTFTSNSATGASGLGGAIAAATGAPYTITDCTFTGNSAGSAGGAMNISGTGVATHDFLRTTFSGNRAATSGGAVNITTTVVGSQFNFTDSTLSGNSAGNGGGALHTVANSFAITNSTIANNTAAGANGGGGIRTGTAGALVTIRNSTIARNSATHASGKGGGLFVTGSTGTVQLDSTIIAANTGATNRDVSGSVAYSVSGTKNLFGSLDTVTFTIDTANNQFGSEATPIDPVLAPLANYGGPTQTMGLLAGSPAIDQGSNVLALSKDQRGSDREDPLGSPDVGAFEGVLAIPSAKATLPPVNTGGGTTYLATVVYSSAASSIDTATIDVNDVLLSGGNYLVPVAPISASFSGSGASVTATYTFTPPGGAWDVIDSGTYTLTMQSNQVADITTQSVVGGSLGSFQVAVQGTLLVDELGDLDDSDYSTGKLSIREALKITNLAVGLTDTITFAPALNGQTITLTGVELPVTNNVVVTGPGATQLTLSANGLSRVLNVSGSTTNLTISGLKIANGKSGTGPGGGILVNAAKLTLTDCALTGHTVTGNGGAIGMQTNTASITVTNCTATGNSASGSGGFVDAGPGGGKVNLFNSTVSGNSANGNGGAFSGGYSTVFVSGSTISGNTANNGGGFHFYKGSGTVENSTLSGNSAKSNGGAINLNNFPTANTFTLRNSTIYQNSAGVAGGGIRGTGTGKLAITSSIVAKNTNSIGPDIYFSAGGMSASGDNNLIGVADVGNIGLSGLNNQTGTLAVPLDPVLGSLTNNGGPTQTHAILPGSPALNAGANPNSLTTDQRGAGFAREVGAADIGAFELQTIPAPPTATVKIDDGSGQRSMIQSFVVTFSEAVEFVTFASNAFTLNRLASSSIPTPSGSVFLDVNPVVGPATSFTITFNDPTFAPLNGNAESLIDGLYELTLVANQIKSASSGQFLDGDGNATPGDDQTTNFHRLFGDVRGTSTIDLNGNGFTDNVDLIAFRNANGSDSTQVNYAPALDVNGDGFIDNIDLIAFRQRLTQTP